MCVGGRVRQWPLRGPGLLLALAPIFSNLYFDAVEDDIAKRTVSRVWAPLFERRFIAEIAPLQFAIAGMNAHINHDLAIALAATTRALGYDLGLDSAHHRDHLRVNTTLARVMGESHEMFGTARAQPLTKSWGGTLGDLFAGWSIRCARDNAWTEARTLVALEHEPLMRKRCLAALARVVGFVSRTLLVRSR